MRTDADLIELLKRLADMNRLTGDGQSAKHFLEVFGDVKGEELSRLVELCRQQAAEASARADAIEAAKRNAELN
jgi:hypothetical protein